MSGLGKSSLCADFSTDFAARSNGLQGQPGSNIRWRSRSNFYVIDLKECTGALWFGIALSWNIKNNTWLENEQVRKQMVERCEQMSEMISEWPGTMYRVHTSRFLALLNRLVSILWGMKFSCHGRSADVFSPIYVQNAHVTYKLIDATYLPIRKLTYHPLTIS